MAINLHSYIKNEIENNGEMPLSVFLETVLNHPQFGYYSNNSVYPIGPHGDFVTAPEISQMFGEMIGAWVIDIWRQMGETSITLIECGPGRGTLMADILRIAGKAPDFLKKLHINFIETSRSLHKEQKSAVERYIGSERVSWSNELVDPKRNCIILGNEFMDVLSIEQVMLENGIWFQRTVKSDNKNGDIKFCFGKKKADNKLTSYLPVSAQNGDTYEISPARIHFIEKCARIIQENTGAALFIDYGYMKACSGDTLQAVRKHEYANVLDNIGSADITSHVDFGALVQVIKANGGMCQPVITQGKFLENLGIKHRAQNLKASPGVDAKEIDIALERLIGHKKMGDLFKVLCFYSGKLKPEGF